MLLPIDRLKNAPILSLQTGGILAHLSSPIIDPRNLVIAAFYAKGPRLSSPESVLHPEDICEISDIGIIVDSESSLMPLDDLVRLGEIINFGFELDGIRVESERGKLLGKVSDFALDSSDFSIQQIYTKPTFLKSIVSTNLIIHRSQIKSINNSRIVVKDPAVTEEKPAGRPADQFVNPFRSPAPSSQTEAKDLR